MCAGIELQALDVYQVIGELRRTPAQYRLDARHQLFGRERLGDVVISAGIEAFDLVLLLRARRQHDDRDVLAARIGAQLAREHGAGHVGQHPVEQNKVRPYFANQGVGFRRTVRALHAVPGVLEIDRDQLLDRRFVFNHQNIAAHTDGRIN